MSNACCNGSFDPAKRRKRAADDNNQDVAYVVTKDSKEVKEYRGDEGRKVIEGMLERERNQEQTEEGNVEIQTRPSPIKGQ